jgi:hypothetical protein
MRTFLVLLLLALPLSALGESFALSDDRSVESLCARLVQNLSSEPAEKRSIRMIHFRGQSSDPRLFQLVTCLHSNAVRVEGTLVGAEEFERVVASLDGTTTGFRLSFVPEAVPPQRTERIRAWARKLFGTPNGLTFIEHIMQRQEPEGRWALKFQDSSDVFHRLAWQSVAVGAASITGSFAYAQWGQPVDIWTQGTQLLLNNAVMGTWVYLFTRYQREQMQVKKQGTHVAWDEFRPEGQQLVVRHNKVLFSGLTLAQELMISFMMVSVNAGPQNLTTSDLGNITLGALSASYAYIPAEMALSKFLDRAQEALQRNDKAEYDRQIRRYTFWMKVWWWGIYATIRNLPMLLPAVDHGHAWMVASLPLFATGTLGWYLDFKRDNPNFWQRVLGRKTSEKDCAAMLEPVVIL